MKLAQKMRDDFEENRFFPVAVCDEVNQQQNHSSRTENNNLNNTRYILRHSLLRSKTCNRIFNRDVNGSNNIRQIAENALFALQRPAHLCRPNKTIQVSEADKMQQHQVQDPQSKKKVKAKILLQVVIIIIIIVIRLVSKIIQKEQKILSNGVASALQWR